MKNKNDMWNKIKFSDMEGQQKIDNLDFFLHQIQLMKTGNLLKEIKQDNCAGCGNTEPPIERINREM